MMFTPVNGHVDVEPVEQDSPVASQDVTYEEKGIVLSYAANCGVPWMDVGITVYFDAWLACKYIDSNGKERWLVPVGNIRAYEPIPELRV